STSTTPWAAHRRIDCRRAGAKQSSGSARGGGSKNLFVQLLRSKDHSRDRELLRSPPRVHTHSLTRSRVRKKSRGVVSEGFVKPGIDEDSVEPGTDQFPSAAGIGRDHRRTARQRFEYDVGQPLPG